MWHLRSVLYSDEFKEGRDSSQKWRCLCGKIFIAFILEWCIVFFIGRTTVFLMNQVRMVSRVEKFTFNSASNTLTHIESIGKQDDAFRVYSLCCIIYFFSGVVLMTSQYVFYRWILLVSLLLFHFQQCMWTHLLSSSILQDLAYLPFVRICYISFPIDAAYWYDRYLQSIVRVFVINYL